MTIATFNRYEIKFLLSQDQYRAIMPELRQRLLLDRNCQNGREYVIHNIYFDTADSRIIRHSLSHPHYKEKLRLRSYGSAAASDSLVFLELKKKIGGTVNKRRAELTLQDAGRFLDSRVQPGGRDYMNFQVLNEISNFLDKYPVQPAVYIGYRRTAWFGRDDPEFRVTFDRRIITRRCDLRLDKGRYGSDLLEPDQLLMEIKTTGAIPAWLARLLSASRIYRTSFSKYGQEYQNHLEQEKIRRLLRKAG